MHRQGVFISYSHKDKKWLEHLRTHLSVLERHHQLDIWDDTKIRPGSEWRQEITDAMGRAKVALLLISPNFLSSNFIHEEELPMLLAAAEAEGALIFPIIISYCMFEDLPSLSKFQSVNQVSRPVVNMDEGQCDAFFLRVAREVKAALLDAEVSAEIFDHKPIVPKKAKASLGLFKQSITRTAVLRVMSENTEAEKGLSITSIMKKAGLKSRKLVFQSIAEMEEADLVSRLMVGKNVYWKLSEKGEKLMNALHEAIVFN